MLLLWTAVTVIVNPVGEFMINDDWSFVRILEVLSSEGRLMATGWGKGGPSAIVHILWGGLFTEVAGFSLTALRLSVLAIGIMGSAALLCLLRFAAAPVWLAFLGVVTLLFNPLFLSQCFTFMTDITFASLAIFSLLFLWLGAERRNTGLIVIGLVFALAAILTRQIGIVIPFSFVAACFLLPAGKDLGRTRILLLAMGIAIAPWIAYEYYLHYAGSTPVTSHAVFRNILGAPLAKGLLGYLATLCVRLFHNALGYACLLVSPLLVLRYREVWPLRLFRGFVAILTAAFVLFEIGILAGLLDPPVAFHRNVIRDFGIGPILLKDTYILGIQRTFAIPKWAYYLIVYWSILSIAVTVILGVLFSGRLLAIRAEAPARQVTFLQALTFLCALAYLGIIMLTGFHDRYLIPVCIFLIVWLISDKPDAFRPPALLKELAPCVVMPALLAVFSVGGTRDFMEMKRAQAKAQDFLLKELKIAPCRFDGGFEFNGYRCYKKEFEPKEGLSWWWVEREDYLVTLGPLPNYTVVRTFPFTRILGEDGQIHVLRPRDQ